MPRRCADFTLPTVRIEPYENMNDSRNVLRPPARNPKAVVCRIADDEGTPPHDLGAVPPTHCLSRVSRLRPADNGFGLWCCLQSFDGVEQGLQPALRVDVQEREGLFDAVARVFNVLERLCGTSIGCLDLEVLADHQRRDSTSWMKVWATHATRAMMLALMITAGKALRES
jgi:hypothetical protein